MGKDKMTPTSGRSSRIRPDWTNWTAPALKLWHLEDGGLQFDIVDYAGAAMWSKLDDDAVTIRLFSFDDEKNGEFLDPPALDRFRNWLAKPYNGLSEADQIGEAFRGRTPDASIRKVAARLYADNALFAAAVDSITPVRATAVSLDRVMSLSQIALYLNYDRQTVRQWISCGCPVIRNTNVAEGYQLDIAKVVSWLQKCASDETKTTETLSEAQRRKSIAEADLAEIEVERRRGGLPS